MSKMTRRFFPFILLCITVASLNAQELSGQEMQRLDGQVQEIKSDVLSISSELSILEERLLYPSNTQVAVFVSIEKDEDFRLDAVQVEIFNLCKKTISSCHSRTSMVTFATPSRRRASAVSS